MMTRYKIMDYNIRRELTDEVIIVVAILFKHNKMHRYK